MIIPARTAILLTGTVHQAVVATVTAEAAEAETDEAVSAEA